jgi:hypothetical protein
LVALSLVAPIALSIACLVRRRSGTTTSSQGQARLSERFILSLGEEKQAKEVEATLAQEPEMGWLREPAEPAVPGRIQRGGSDSGIFLDDREGESGAMLQVLEIGGEPEGTAGWWLMPGFFLPQDGDGYDGASPRQNVFEGLSREPAEGSEADAGVDSTLRRGLRIPTMLWPRA